MQQALCFHRTKISHNIQIKILTTGLTINPTLQLCNFSIALLSSLLFFNTKIINKPISTSNPYIQLPYSMAYLQRDSLSIKSNKILANLFAELILLSEKIQTYRQILASVPYYDSVQLFRVLDHNHKGLLILNDFTRLMGQDYKKFITYAFSWFDQAKLGEISRLQFIAFLMPRRNQELRQMVARRIEEPSNDENFSSTINEQLIIFTELLNQIISHQLKIIEQRKLLLKQQDYSVKGVLNSLDILGLDFASTNDLLKFLRNYAIEATREQLEDFLEIVDSKLKGKITEEQLKWIVEGLESSKGEYKQKIKKSSKKLSQSVKKKLSEKTSQIEQDTKQVVKQFIRSPLKQNKQNYSSRPIEVQSSEVSKFSVSQNNWQQASKFQISNKASQVSQAKKQVHKQSFQQREQLLQRPGSQQKENQFEKILKKYREAEAETIRKDAELIMAEMEMKDKLQEEFIQRSNSRRRAITESNSVASDIRRKPAFESTRDCAKQYKKQDYSRQSQDYSRQSLQEKTLELTPARYYQYPYSSKYDRKINTIVDNFYTRNNQTAPLHYSQKRHGINSTSFYDRVGEFSYGTASNSRIKFLQDEVERQRQKDRDRVRPFDYPSNFVKQQISKKLGDDIHNIKLPSRAYDALAHQARQRPLEESIKKMKESTDRIDQQRQRMASSSAMMENISIISRDSIKKGNESGKKPSETKQVNEVNQMNVFRTDYKQSPGSGLMPGYQTIYNGDSKSRGQRTTETKYPYAQTQNKMTPWLLRIEQENSMQQ